VGQYPGPRLTDALNAARELDLDPDAKHAALVLASYWPNVYPSVARLARDMGISERAVRLRLRKLTDAGLIESEHRGGMGSSARRRLLFVLPGSRLHGSSLPVGPTSGSTVQASAEAGFTRRSNEDQGFSGVNASSLVERVASILADFADVDRDLIA